MSNNNLESSGAYATKKPVLSPKVDLRVQRTLEQIRDAFIALMLERPFDQITVSLLAQKARINRATFYRHYADIHDLADRLTDLMFVDTITHMNAQNEEERLASWQVMFDHVARYAAFYRALIGPGGVPGFRERVEAAVAEQMVRLLPAFGFAEDGLQMPLPLAVQYMAAAQVGFVKWWLENDMPFSSETAAGHLVNLHTYGGLWALGLAI